MVEDAIQDDLDAAAFRFAGQGLEGGQRAKIGIDHQVILGVVQVVRGGLEDRVEVDDGDALSLEVIQFIDHSLQVAAVELVAIFVGAKAAARIAQVLVPGQLAHRLGINPVSAIGGVIAGVAVAEALGVDLVDDRILQPGRGGKVLVVNRDLVAVVISGGQI